MIPRREAVLFDLDGVLCDYDFARRLQAIADRAGVTPDLVDEVIFRSGFDEAADNGELDADAYIRGFAERLGRPFGVEEWVAARRESMAARPEMFALVERLKFGGVPVGMLTNNGPLLKAHMAAIAPEAASVFGDAAMYSFEFGVGKPAPEVFRRACDRLDRPPEATVFFDDSPDYVRGALSAGLDALLFESAAACEAALRERGLL